MKAVVVVLLVTIAGAAQAQTGDAPLSLEVAQQRARFARDQVTTAEEKVSATEKKDKAAKKRLEEANAQSDRTAKELQERQAELAKARERHDHAYQELKRSHEASQESK